KSVTVQRAADVNEVWTPSSDGGMAIRQRVERSPIAGIRRLVLVVDGSKGMKSFAGQISEAVAKLPNNLELKLLIAGDFAPIREGGTTAFEPEKVEAIQRRLTRAAFEGGQDNLPALAAAWDMASAVEGGAVLWLHGAEPVLLSAESGLLQRLERNLMRTRLFEMQTEAGPDRIVEKLDAFSHFLPVPRLSSLREDLTRLFGQWSGGVPSFNLKRERSSDGQNGVQVSRHVERLWARDETLRLAHAHQPEEATKLAVKNQLVTPLTGAVVLERKEQYERHGLTPAAASTVPSVPEPSSFSLVGVGILAYAIARRRRAANAKSAA
ncbi:MAG TPA: PEP-CTERM sorting domain-containing protein, partial [Candidatus Paceibacterota bacterium]|nr:PEP-CTERM sorting domain-containing protein [Candidatus Paceibacterota bacterium]